MGKSTGNGANIAWFFYAAMGRVGWGITLGAPGLNRGFPTQKWQKRRRDGVSGNFQIHLEDPGRNLRFLHLPALTQNHAAAPARPRSARTLRGSFYAAMGRVGGITLGALPLKPWQEPEVPAPPGFYSEPCSVFSSSALRADIARFFYALRCISQDYVRGGAVPLGCI